LVFFEFFRETHICNLDLHRSLLTPVIQLVRSFNDHVFDKVFQIEAGFGVFHSSELWEMDQNVRKFEVSVNHFLLSHCCEAEHHLLEDSTSNWFSQVATLLTHKVLQVSSVAELEHEVVVRGSFSRGEQATDVLMRNFRHQLNLVDDKLLELVLNQGLVHDLDCEVSIRVVRHVSVKHFAVLPLTQHFCRQLD